MAAAILVIDIELVFEARMASGGQICKPLAMSPNWQDLPSPQSDRATERADQIVTINAEVQDSKQANAQSSDMFGHSKLLSWKVQNGLVPVVGQKTPSSPDPVVEKWLASKVHFQILLQSHSLLGKTPACCAGKLTEIEKPYDNSRPWTLMADSEGQVDVHLVPL